LFQDRRLCGGERRPGLRFDLVAIRRTALVADRRGLVEKPASPDTGSTSSRETHLD
jgi:hypothetical protein